MLTKHAGRADMAIVAKIERMAETMTCKEWFHEGCVHVPSRQLEFGNNHIKNH